MLVRKHHTVNLKFPTYYSFLLHFIVNSTIFCNKKFYSMAIELLTTFLWINNYCIIIAQFSAIVLILELCTSLGLHLWNLMGKKLGTCSRPKLILYLCSEPEIQQVALNADKFFWTFFLNLVACFKLHFFLSNVGYNQYWK